MEFNMSKNSENLQAWIKQEGKRRRATRVPDPVMISSEESSGMPSSRDLCFQRKKWLEEEFCWMWSTFFLFDRKFDQITEFESLTANRYSNWSPTAICSTWEQEIFEVIVKFSGNGMPHFCIGEVEISVEIIIVGEHENRILGNLPKFQGVYFRFILLTSLISRFLIVIVQVNMILVSP